MQLVEPEETLPSLLFNWAVKEFTNLAVPVVTSDIGRGINVLLGSLEHVCHQAVEVKERKRRAGPSFLDDKLKGYTVLQHRLGAGEILHELIVVVSHVVSSFVEPGWVVESTTVLGDEVGRGAFCGRGCNGDKVTATSLVECVKDVPDTAGVRSDVGAPGIRIGKEAIGSQVVSSNQDSVGSVVSRAVAIKLVKLKISLESWNLLVQDRREGFSRSQDKLALNDLVGASSTANGVVEALGASFASHHSGPLVATAGRGVSIFGEDGSRGR